MKIAILGGGAAGIFSAISAKENYPKAEVVVFEKSKNLLSKLKISGGGRCNVTNACADMHELEKAYPRGGRFLKKAFYTFSTKDTVQWFEDRGVKLITQEDNCIFPESQNSQTIIDCFLNEVDRLKISIVLETRIVEIVPNHSKLELHFKESKPLSFDKVIVATGGSPKRKGLEWLEKLNHHIEEPVPSLFTFNMPLEVITKLMGVVVENTIVSIQGEKIQAVGPLLITHWGMSGPAIIKLSSFAARILSDNNYRFVVQVNWVNNKNNALVLKTLEGIKQQHPKKKLVSIKPFSLPERLWVHLLEKSALSPEKRWVELGKKGMNRMVELLTNDTYKAEGKTTFKEEFVTCGGVSLKDVDVKTMQSKQVKNLYFAGEVLDIDGITGGFNFQAAWTTGFIAGKLKI